MELGKFGVWASLEGLELPAGRSLTFDLHETIADIPVKVATSAL